MKIVEKGNYIMKYEPVVCHFLTRKGIACNTKKNEDTDIYTTESIHAVTCPKCRRTLAYKKAIDVEIRKGAKGVGDLEVGLAS